ncbi:MAG TPA: family 43 glycosylhydrolase, partial [Verrucomicrobiae bacterium]
IAVSDSPAGPFTLLKTNGPVPPANFMTLDGTFYLDPAGQPWMVYAHEWIQKIDGTMEAVPLTEDLVNPTAAPTFLFKASDAPWLDEQGRAWNRESSYVTDGPELFRTKDKHLLMLWSSYDTNGYVETVARSKSGELQGPWEQLPPLIGGDSGHGMLFHTFYGQLMLVLHRPFNNAYGKLYEMADEGDHLRVVRERMDLDGDGEAGKR